MNIGNIVDFSQFLVLFLSLIFFVPSSSRMLGFGVIWFKKSLFSYKGNKNAKKFMMLLKIL